MKKNSTEIKQVQFYSLLLFASLLACGGQICIYLPLPALPSLANQVDIGLTNSQFIMSLYFISFGFSQLLTCYLYPIFTIKKWGFISFSLLLIAGGMSYLSGNFFVGMIIGRIIQGLGAGIGTTIGRSLLAYTLESKLLTKANAYLSIFIAIITISGPIAGGYLTQFGGPNLVMLTISSYAFLGLISIFFLKPIDTIINTKNTTIYSDKFRFHSCLQTTFIKYSLYAALLLASLCLLMTIYPYILNIQFKESSSSKIGWYLSIFSISYILGSLSAVLFNKNYQNFLLKFGLIIAIGSVFMLALCKIFSNTNLLYMTIFTSIYIYSAGILYPIVYTRALVCIPDHKEIAVGICGFMQMLAVFLASLLTTYFFL